MEPESQEEFQPQPIPKQLYSDYLQEPFKECLICERELTKDMIYKIQKSFNGKECVMEAATCLFCMEEMMKEMSKESQENLTKYFENVQFYGENHCELCATDISKVQRRIVAGICQGIYLVHRVENLCENCLLEAQELLSEQTRDYRQRFRERYFPGIPAEGLPQFI
jgi:hypothetical protein